MSGAGAVLAALSIVPITFGVTRRMHERWRARWRLRNHDPLDADAREGDRVFVTGTVRPLDETLLAPLSGRECVAYRSRVSGSTANRTSMGWQETMQLRPFLVEREEGMPIVIDSDRAIFGLAGQKLAARNFDREASFLARHGLTSKGRARFSEVLVELGAHICVGGTLVLVPRDAPPTNELGFRDPPPPDPQLGGNREEPLVIVARGR